MQRNTTIIRNVILYLCLLIPLFTYFYFFSEIIWKDNLFFWMLPFTLVFLILWTHPIKTTALKFSNIDSLKSIKPSWKIRFFYYLPVIKVLGLSFIVFALARPLWGNADTKVTTQGIAIMSVIDVSGSMKALDFTTKTKRQNRLDVVKKVFREFVLGGKNMSGRKNDLIGIVAFGGYPDSKCPLTLDHGALLSILKKQVHIIETKYNSQGEPVNAEDAATAIGDALVIGVERLKNYSGKSKVLILLTDGENTAGITDPLDGAALAKTEGIKIYAIGIGSNGPVPFPMRDSFGQEHLQSVQMKLDEKLLKKIAKTTGGKYFNAKDMRTLKAIYNEIDTLERKKIKTTYSEHEELYILFLIPALLLLLLEKLLKNTLLRKIP